MMDQTDIDSVNSYMPYSELFSEEELFAAYSKVQNCEFDPHTRFRYVLIRFMTGAEISKVMFAPDELEATHEIRLRIYWHTANKDILTFTEYRKTYFERRKRVANGELQYFTEAEHNNPENIKYLSEHSMLTQKAQVPSAVPNRSEVCISSAETQCSPPSPVDISPDPFAFGSSKNTVAKTQPISWAEYQPSNVETPEVSKANADLIWSSISTLQEDRLRLAKRLNLLQTQCNEQSAALKALSDQVQKQEDRLMKLEQIVNKGDLLVQDSPKAIKSKLQNERLSKLEDESTRLQSQINGLKNDSIEYSARFKILEEQLHSCDMNLVIQKTQLSNMAEAIQAMPGANTERLTSISAEQLQLVNSQIYLGTADIRKQLADLTADSKLYELKQQELIEYKQKAERSFSYLAREVNKFRKQLLEMQADKKIKLNLRQAPNKIDYKVQVE